MDVFSTIDNPTWALKLTEDTYIRRTGRDSRYVRQGRGKDGKARYALCPKCQGPILLVNYVIPRTEAHSLYGKHVNYSLDGLANYSQEAYDLCPLKNPQRIDKSRKRPSTSPTNKRICSFLKSYLDIIFSTIEELTGIMYSAQARQKMVKDFAADKAWECESVNTANLPYALLFFSEAIELVRCRVRTYGGLGKELIDCINKSVDFEVDSKRHNTIVRTKPSSRSLNIFFSNHIASHHGESIRMHIIERDPAYGNDFYTTLMEKKVTFDLAKFINTCSKREHIYKLATQYF